MLSASADARLWLAMQHPGIYSYEMLKLREPEMQRIARTIVDRVEKAGLGRVSGTRAKLEARIVTAFRKNIRAEEEIEAEAARFAEAHGRELVGMDRYKVLQLVKERIAKQKGFTL